MQLTGWRSSRLAAIVALSSLGRPDLAIFAAAYIASGYPLAVLAAIGFRRYYHGAGA